MKLVIADTGPINYLLLIGSIDILPALFQRVILPAAVGNELGHPDSPDMVRNWIAAPPPWLEVHHARGPKVVAGLGAGETEAITLAVELHADLVLMDDRRGVKAARDKGIEVTGTMGILILAGEHGILNVADAFSRLKRTSFRYSPKIMDEYLDEENEKS